MDLPGPYQGDDDATAMPETQAFAYSNPEFNDAMQMDGYLNTGANFIEYQDAFSYHNTSTIYDQNYLGTYLGSPNYNPMDFNSPYDNLTAPNHLIPYGQNTWDYTAAPDTMEPASQNNFLNTYVDPLSQDVGQANYQNYPGNPTTSQSAQTEPAKRKARNKTPDSSDKFKVRKEFGLLQIKMTESTLRIIRKHYEYIPRPVFQKHEPGTERSVRLTAREVENLRTHLARKGIKMKTYRRETNFGKAGPAASAHYEVSMAKRIAKATRRNIDEVLAEIRAHVV